MKLVFAWPCLLLIVLSGCAGTTSSSAPPRSQSTPAPTPGVTSTPTTPLPTTPTPPPTTPTPTTPAGTSPLAPTPTTTTPTTTVGNPTTTLPAVGGTWNASLTSTTGTPSLSFTVTLQQNADNTITGTALTFTRTSACFTANTAVTGQISANTLTLVLTSAVSGGANVVQMQLTPTTTSNVLSGTYVVTPATGVAACGVETGTASMLRM